MYNIAILASGSGTNAENIVRTFNNGTLLRVRLVITDQPDAGVIQRMQKYDIPTQYIPGKVWRNDPQQVVDVLRNANIDFVVLAGFMRLIAPPIVKAYHNRIINIHPALLPNYGGKGMYGHHVHEAVIAAGEKQSGVTVHYVDTQYDHGQTILQETVDITPDDTPQTLEQKIHTLEYSIFPRAIVIALERLGNSTPPPLPPTVETPKLDVEEVTIVPESSEPSDAAEADEQPEPPAEQPEPSVDKQWADALHMPYTPQPQTPPALGDATDNASNTPPPLNAKIKDTPHDVEPMPNNWFALSIIVTLACSIIPGIIAIIFSSQVSNAYYQGNIEGAKRASRNAEIWIIISFCLGVLSATLYVPMMLVSNLFN